MYCQTVTPGGGNLTTGKTTKIEEDSKTSTPRVVDQVNANLQQCADERNAKTGNSTTTQNNTPSPEWAQTMANRYKPPKNEPKEVDYFQLGFESDYKNDSAKDASESREPTFRDLTVNSFKQGYNNASLGQEAWKAMYGQENEMDKYAEELRSDDYNFKTESWWKNAVSGAAQQLGQWGRQMNDPDTLTLAMGMGGAAFLAGLAGPQAMVPEEIVTVPGAFMAGVTAVEIEGGLAYLEMLENGVSEETARMIATGVGAVNAGLEFLQLDELVKAYKVLDKIGADDTLLQTVIRELAQRGIDVTTQVVQEDAQELVTIGGVQLGSKLDTGEWAYSADEVSDCVWDTTKNSALTFMLTNVPAAGNNIYVQSRAKLSSDGYAKLRSGVMPNDAELRAMGVSESEALGALAIFEMERQEAAVITDGSHLQDGQLTPNVTYKTGEHDYIYKTNNDGLIYQVVVDELQFKTHDGRLDHNPNTYGKRKGDHAGHLIGDRFGGSPELDNLVSQAQKVNTSEYRIIENKWATALENGYKVSVKIDIKYDEGNVRPVVFEVSYEIDGVHYQKRIKN